MLESFKPSDIYFVGEQDGSVERELGTRLATHFAKDIRIRKAYLVRVRYKEALDVKIAVCLAHDGADPRLVVEGIGSEFRQMFKTTQSLDIIFLSHEQEQEVAAVAKPFYQQSALKA